MLQWFEPHFLQCSPLAAIVREDLLKIGSRFRYSLFDVHIATPTREERCANSVPSFDFGQFLALSTILFLAIHGIMARSLAPTSSMGCAAEAARMALNEVWLTLFSSIQSRAKRPD